MYQRTGPLSRLPSAAAVRSAVRRASEEVKSKLADIRTSPLKEPDGKLRFHLTKGAETSLTAAYSNSQHNIHADRSTLPVASFPSSGDGLRIRGFAPS